MGGILGGESHNCAIRRFVLHGRFRTKLTAGKPVFAPQQDTAKTFFPQRGFLGVSDPMQQI